MTREFLKEHKVTIEVYYPVFDFATNQIDLDSSTSSLTEAWNRE